MSEQTARDEADEPEIVQAELIEQQRDAERHDDGVVQTFGPILEADTKTVVGEQRRSEQQQPTVVTRRLHGSPHLGE